MVDITSATLIAMAEELEKAISTERQRCYDIVQAARRGEIDGDFRVIAAYIWDGNAPPAPHQDK